MRTREEKAALIATRPWFHSIQIEKGLVTPGRASSDYLHGVLKHLRFPDSFEGLSVLDIGAWDGFFSFEAERRGARRVVAYDLHPRDHYGFAVAHDLLGSKVEYVQGSAYDLSPEVHGTFDVVFFFGVLYHLRYPLLALDRIREVTDGYMLLESHCLDRKVIFANGKTVPLGDIDPRMESIALYQFYRNDELGGDFSNWFAPNSRALEDALWSAGFRPERLGQWDSRAAFKGVKVPGIPEYQRETYEGLKWVTKPEGGQEPIFPLRDKGGAGR